MSVHEDLLRSKAGHDSSKVAFVELFFDLVFVFAITQLSHSLIGHFSALGAAQVGMLLLAVWWVWIFTAWVTNWLDPEKLPVRIALLAMMVLGLVLSAALPGAFGSRGPVFAGAYVAMQVGRTLFVLWAAKGQPVLFRTFQRILFWLALGGIFWIAGACFHGATRMACWGLALAIEYASPSLGFHTPGFGKSSSADWDISGHHIAERCGLFIIIALGESILVAGATFAGMVWSGPVLAAFASTVIGSIAMWWLYFDAASNFGAHTISSSRNPGQLARLAYTYLHLFLVAGIILTAVADEFVLAHPSGHCDAKTTAAVLGGAMLYLLGSLLFKRAISGAVPRSHWVAIGLIAALAPAGSHLAPWLLSGLVTLILCAIAAWERHARCLSH
jgi:low temperature requirement protein LtrA